MRIGVNALFLLPGKVGGTEIFTRSMVRGLAEAGGANEYFIFINRESVGVFEGVAPNVKVVLCPIKAVRRPVRILYEQLVLPFQLLRHGIDVLYSAGMTAPFFCPASSVLVIHDLQHVNQPQNFTLVQRIFLRTIIYLSARRSDAVATVSSHVKKDVLRHYGIAPEKVSVTYNAADLEAFRPRGKGEVEAVREKYGLPERFVLYIASSLPHKNYRRLLEAFKLASRDVKGLKLVLIGSRDYGGEAIREAIVELGLTDEVVLLGWLPFEDLPPIYCAAEVFVFPSLHEGFGIPVVEAMACGVPVVCSEIEPLVEVAGGAALLVDPAIVGSIAAGLRTVLTDPGVRRRLKEAGLERATHFSWKRSAEETLRLIGSLKS